VRLENAERPPNRTVTSSGVEIDAGAIFGHIILSTVIPTVFGFVFLVGKIGLGEGQKTKRI
jgi:hypothetical protein